MIEINAFGRKKKNYREELKRALQTKVFEIQNPGKTLYFTAEGRSKPGPKKHQKSASFTKYKGVRW